MQVRLMKPHVESRIRCPVCRGRLELSGDECVCKSCDQRGGAGRFPLIEGKPLLVRHDNPFISPEVVSRLTATAPKDRRARLKRGRVARVYRALMNANRVGVRHAHQVLDALPVSSSRAPVVLEIGGATPGRGSEVLRQSQIADAIAFDVYASPFVDFVADAHEIPMSDASIDAVWIQAVLEHVVDPARVVAEIHRVLAPGGIVYAETPFMQQGHEGAHDFTRFTHSGHRWLFRAFDEVASGPVGGAGTSLIWSIRYFVRTLTGSDNAARLAAATCFWLRFADELGARRQRLDAASGFYFLGRKNTRGMQTVELLDYFDRSSH